VAELAIKIFGRDVTLENTADHPEYFEAELGPKLKLFWGSNCLTLWANHRMVQPNAGGDDIEAAARMLEERLDWLGPIFATWKKPPVPHTGPVPMALHCPKCSAEHVDRDEWATKPHRTHLCESCQHEWDPYDFETVGVAENDDDSQTEAEVSYSSGGHDGPGWYYWDSEYPEEGAVGAFESFEEAARHAAQSYYRVRPPQIARPA
jgi:hypothetical protein